MPKLVLLVPCEKALIGADNGLSLINVFHAVTAMSPHATEEMDEATSKAETRNEWTVVSTWQRESGDEGKRFEQRLTLTDPVGKVRIQGLTDFELRKDFHRLMGKIPGFPREAMEGEYTIAIAIRPAGATEEEWVTKGQYPLTVSVRRAPQNQQV